MTNVRRAGWLEWVGTMAVLTLTMVAAYVLVMIA